MSIQEHHLLIARIIYPLFAFVILGSGFEINGMTDIRFVFKDANDRGLCPFERIAVI